MIAKRSTVIKNCKWCGREFTVRLAEIKRDNGRFCSISCSSQWSGAKDRKDSRGLFKVDELVR